MTSLYDKEVNERLSVTPDPFTVEPLESGKGAAVVAAHEVSKKPSEDKAAPEQMLRVTASPRAKDAVELAQLVIRPSHKARASGARFETVYLQELTDMVLCKEEPIDIKTLQELCLLFDVATLSPGGLKLKSAAMPRQLPKIAACIQQVFEQHKETLASISQTVQGYTALHK